MSKYDRRKPKLGGRKQIQMSSCRARGPPLVGVKSRVGASSCSCSSSGHSTYLHYAFLCRNRNQTNGRKWCLMQLMNGKINRKNCVASFTRKYLCQYGLCALEGCTSDDAQTVTVQSHCRKASTLNLGGYHKILRSRWPLLKYC